MQYHSVGVFSPGESICQSIAGSALWLPLGALGCYVISPLVSGGICLEGALWFTGLQPIIYKIFETSAYPSQREHSFNPGMRCAGLATACVTSALLTTYVAGYSLTLTVALALEGALIATFALATLGILEAKFLLQTDLFTREEFYAAEVQEVLTRLITPFQSWEADALSFDNPQNVNM